MRKLRVQAKEVAGLREMLFVVPLLFRYPFYKTEKPKTPLHREGQEK
jgi:hypothetical protein